MVCHSRPRLLACLVGYLLFAICLLPVDSVEEFTDQCVSDAACKDNELASLLQGHVAKEHTLTMTEDDMLTNASAVPKSKIKAKLDDMPMPDDGEAPGLASGAESLASKAERAFEGQGWLAFVSALSGFSAILLMYVVAFMVLLRFLPRVYAYNVLAGTAPVTDLSGVAGCRWVTAAWNVTTEDAIKYIGLDGAMFLEFINMSTYICGALCVTMFVLAPTNRVYGGGKETDPVFMADERNVAPGHSWLFWRDAIVLWYVIIVVEYFADKSNRKFKQLRSEWLKQIPPPQSHTILIQHLAVDLCSDDALKRYMTKLFAQDALESCFVVRAEDGQFTRNGFVTFKKRRDAEVALCLHLDDSVLHDMNVVSAPPDPADVEYDVLQQANTNPTMDSIQGVALMILLFLAYLPLVFFVAFLASVETLSYWIPPFGNLCKDSPMFVSVWEGIVGPTLLTILPGFIPTILLAIIQGYFALPAVSWCQNVLERWYFAFQVTFTLIVFSFSHSFMALMQLILKDPGHYLIEFVPSFSNVSFFYLLFIAADVATQTSTLLRSTPLLKFLWYSRSHDPEEAHKLAEPEAQDYYGIGSRSARMVLILVITLVYSTLETGIALMALLDFLVCRLVYTYLMVFAESRKPDSGGRIWISQLQQVQFGLFLYALLMTSIIFVNSTNSPAPGYFALLAFLLLYKFHKDIKLERLTVDKVVDLDEAAKGLDASGIYAQPKPQASAEKPKAQSS